MKKYEIVLILDEEWKNELLNWLETKEIEPYEGEYFNLLSCAEAYESDGEN